MTAHRFEIAKMTTHCGAEVHGVNLAQRRGLRVAIRGDRPFHRRG